MLAPHFGFMILSIGPINCRTRNFILNFNIQKINDLREQFINFIDMIVFLNFFVSSKCTETRAIDIANEELTLWNNPPSFIISALNFNLICFKDT